MFSGRVLATLSNSSCCSFAVTLSGPQYISISSFMTGNFSKVSLIISCISPKNVS
ncbi:hypothetical protein DsansV1_C04g0045781 [Dioscorea sansibarensis]